MIDRKVAAAITAAARQLDAVSDSPRLDAELLMAHALHIDRSAMLLQLRDLIIPAEFAALVARRMQHEPIAYIRGYQDFWDLTLTVSPNVLIPRADSEALIEAAAGYFANRPAPCRILDLGTGSGALLLAALSLFPNATGLGMDASAPALAVAAGNAADLGFAARADFQLGSWHDSKWSGEIGTFALILCNPPYVERDAVLQASVCDFEPAQALYAGVNGLDDYQIIMPKIPALLTANGIAIFEIGKGQDEAVSAMAASAGLVADQHRDLAGIVRALSFTAIKDI
jgi:release factor glutamine methyltransferase